MEMDNPPRNPQKGFRNIQTSAKIGLPIAQATLGVIYLTGSGIERDVNEGVKWCSLGARKKSLLQCIIWDWPTLLEMV